MDFSKDLDDARIDLIKELGIDSLPPRKKEEKIMELGEILQQRIITRLVEEMPEDQRARLISTIEKQKENASEEERQKTAEEANKLIMEQLPNAEELIMEEIGKFKREEVELHQQALSKN